MMLTISVRFLHGTFRADIDDVSLTGQESRGEWPPSPARLFSALVAADGTGEQCRVTDGSELREIEAAEPPEIYADPKVLRSRIRERYVVLDKTSSGTVQSYPLRQSVLVRPGTRIAPLTPHVTYVWPDLSPDERAVNALAARAARVGYLGCADSPVQVGVAASADHVDPGTRWAPDNVGEIDLPTPYVGTLDVLDDAYARFTSGESIRRAWLPSRRVRYRSPAQPQADKEAERPAIVWLRLESPVPGRKVLAVTETLRAAVLEKYERHVAGSPDRVPRMLHGHGFDGLGYQHACWLALPDVGFPHSRGRIHGVAVWLPPGSDTQVVEGVRAVVGRIHELVKPGHFRSPVRRFAGEKRPYAANPERWERSSRRWVTAFPVVHERWQKGGPDLSEVARWCEHASLPAPIGFRSFPVPLAVGAVSLMPNETRRNARESRPFSHVEVKFAEPVKGPVMLGRARQFGLGLMIPADRDRMLGLE